MTIDARKFRDAVTWVNDPERPTVVITGRDARGRIVREVLPAPAPGETVFGSVPLVMLAVSRRRRGRSR
mgnify:CR=1 FL=1